MASFNEVCIDLTKTAKKIPQSDYLISGKYKIFDQGKDYIGGYTNDNTGIVEAYPYIVFGDHTRIIKFVDEPCFIGADGVKLLKVYNSLFLPKYVYYSLVANPIVSSGYSRHFKYLKEQSIRDCSIDEQKRIITELETNEKAISIKKESLSSLDELVKSRFIELFGGIHYSKKYPYIAVKELTEVISGGTPSRDVSEYWKEGTIPWIKTTELHNNVITKSEEYITEKGLNNSSAKIVPAGTVLIAMYGQGKTRGMTAYSEIKACTNQACACILPSDKINQKFLWYFFILSYDNLRDLAKGGNQPNLNGNMIKTYPILYPPRELQERFAAFVKKIDKSKFIVQQQIKDLQELLDSKMDEYFR